MDSHEVSTMWSAVAALLAGAVSWGGARHAIGTLKNDVCESKKSIKALQEELKSFVSAKFCRIERQDCKENRRENTELLTKKFDELMDRIDLQDQKRHDNANAVQKVFAEFYQKLSALETKIDERSRRFRKDDTI